MGLETDQPQPPADVVQLLEDMIGGDGYGAIIHKWPASGIGPALIEIVAHEGACARCLVPKSVLARVLGNEFPDGVTLDETDLIYPVDV